MKFLFFRMFFNSVGKNSIENVSVAYGAGIILEKSFVSTILINL